MRAEGVNDSARSDRLLFARDSLLLIVSSGFAGLLFVLTQSLLGRKMEPVDYSVLVSLLGLLNVLNLPASTIQVVMARYVSEFANANAADVWTTVLRRAASRVGWLGAGALLAWCLLSGVIRTALNAPDVASIVMLGIIALVGLYAPIVQGTLQGSRHFGWMATSGIGTAASRFLLALTVVMLGGGVPYVLGAIAVSSAAGVCVGYVPLRRHMAGAVSLEQFDMQPIYRYLWPVLLGQGSLFLLVNADLILSPRFLSGMELAAYGKAAMLSRIVLFLPLPVALAMFPRAVTSGSRSLILYPLAFSLCVSLLAALFISLVPAIPMLLMYGVSDAIYLDMVRIYVWAVIPLALIQILAQYMWARSAAGTVLWLLPCMACYIAVLWCLHATPAQMITSLAAGSWGSLLVLISVAAVRLLR